MRGFFGSLGMSRGRAFQSRKRGAGGGTPPPDPIVFTPTHIWNFETVPGYEGWPNAIDRLDSSASEARSLIPFSPSHIFADASKFGDFAAYISGPYGLQFYNEAAPLRFYGDFSIEMFVRVDELYGKHFSTLLSGAPGSLVLFGLAGDQINSNGWFPGTSEPNPGNRLCFVNGYADPVFFGLNQAVTDSEFVYVAFFRKDGMLNVNMGGTVGTPVADNSVIQFDDGTAVSFFGGTAAGDPNLSLNGFIDSIRLCSGTSALAHANSTPPTSDFPF